jgi:hypothetical protein
MGLDSGGMTWGGVECAGQDRHLGGGDVSVSPILQVAEQGSAELVAELLCAIGDPHWADRSLQGLLSRSARTSSAIRFVCSSPQVPREGTEA